MVRKKNYSSSYITSLSITFMLLNIATREVFYLTVNGDWVVWHSVIHWSYATPIRNINMMGMFDVAGLGLLGPAVPSNVGLYFGLFKKYNIYTFFVMSKLTD